MIATRTLHGCTRRTIEAYCRGTLMEKIHKAECNARYGTKCCHRDCFPRVLPFLYGGGELLLACGGAAGAQRSDWLAAVRSRNDVCGHPRFYALHCLD